MTSYVEYHGHGFYCRNAILRDWLREVLSVSAKRSMAWLPKATGYWDAVRCGLRSNTRTDLRLTLDLTTPAVQQECEALFEAVAARSLTAPVKRCALLAVSLVRGELAGAIPTVLDYWTDEEWMA